MSEVKTVKKAKLKAVKSSKPRVVVLNEQNNTYLEHYLKKTRNSVNRLLNDMVAYCRENDSLKNTPNHEPRSLVRARELIAKWEGSKKRASNA